MSSQGEADNIGLCHRFIQTDFPSFRTSEALRRVNSLNLGQEVKAEFKSFLIDEPGLLELFFDNDDDLQHTINALVSKRRRYQEVFYSRSCSSKGSIVEVVEEAESTVVIEELSNSSTEDNAPHEAFGRWSQYPKIEEIDTQGKVDSGPPPDVRVVDEWIHGKHRAASDPARPRPLTRETRQTPQHNGFAKRSGSQDIEGPEAHSPLKKRKTLPQMKSPTPQSPSVSDTDSEDDVDIFALPSRKSFSRTIPVSPVARSHMNSASPKITSPTPKSPIVAVGASPSKARLARQNASKPPERFSPQPIESEQEKLDPLVRSAERPRVGDVVAVRAPDAPFWLGKVLKSPDSKTMTLRWFDKVGRGYMLTGFSDRVEVECLLQFPVKLVSRPKQRKGMLFLSEQIVAQ